MLCPPAITIRHKVIIGVLIGLALIGGILVVLLKYFEVFSDLGQVANKNPLQQPAIDLARLNENYRMASARIFGNFLTAADSPAADIAALADQAQKDLLALSLPAEFRSQHLSAVLLLGEITNLAVSGQTAKLAVKINELKELVAE